MIKQLILVFGGTIEGRKVSEYLVSRKICHTVSVATDYGEEVLEPQEFLTIHQGRMDMETMCDFIQNGGYRMIIDATHPYAVIVSENIRNACERTGVPYMRYLRPLSEQADVRCDGFSVYVNSSKDAAEYLETQQGQIFLTTGSKELHIFTETISDISRIFARVLPAADVIASCRALGLEGKQICGMQGPFSEEINLAMLKQAGSRFLVTKDTGIAGGFPEKVEAARKLGVHMVIIRRPQEDGCSFEELIAAIEQLLREADVYSAVKEQEIHGKIEQLQTEIDECCSREQPEGKAEADIPMPQISCIGIGMGTLESLTYGAAETIKNADIIFGAERIVKSVCSMFSLKADIVIEYMGSKIKAYLKAHPGYRRAAVLMSGDVGFYSGARGIEQTFGTQNVRFYCGISSIVYFASRIPVSWQDAKLISAHGKEPAILNHVMRSPKLMLLVSGKEDVERICRQVADAELKEIRVTVGSNLSYPNERIETGAPEQFLNCHTSGLHIMMIENPKADHVITPGIPDEAFIRGKVPMTKEEIRILSIAKLRLRSDSVIYDVGAGTGSVSIEAARLCTDGRVYAIERNPAGIELIRQNCRKTGISNLIPVEGLAPDAMEELPVPTHAFIGGSSGNMKEIITLLRRKNPLVRIVINTIALESIAEVMKLLKELKIEGEDIVQISAAKSKELGRYHLMTGLNPVYIVSFGGN